MPRNPRTDSLMTDLDESVAAYLPDSNHEQVMWLETRTDGSQGDLS